MNPTLDREIVLDALLVVIHSDQGSQHGCDDWARFLQVHNLKASVNRRGNCLDNMVAESLFSSLKNERIRRKIYAAHAEA